MSKNVFVTDGQTLAALAITRSLGRKGFDVHVGEFFSYNLTSFSKHVTESVEYPIPEEEPNRFLEVLLARLREGDYEFLVPVRDDTTRLISKHKDEISKHVRLYLADYEKIERLNDKGETIKIAQEVGVPTPKTYFPERTDPAAIKRDAKYPILIRPRVSSGSRGITRVETPAEFDRAFEAVSREYGTPMIQEYVEKSGYTTACMLFDDEGAVASFSYERRKEYPLSGGPTVVGVSHDDPTAKEYSRRLLNAVDWKGPAEIEFILDEAGEPRLLEVNPRFWTPVGLAIRSGVDFPYLLYRLAAGVDVEPVTEYDVGVTYRSVFPNEILWLLSTPDKVEGIADFLDFDLEGTCYGTLSRRDPLPVLGTIVQGLNILRSADAREYVFDRGWTNEQIKEGP